MTDLAHIRTAVVDDHALIREGINTVLAGGGVGQVVRFASATALLEAIESGDVFDFYIIDLELPDIDGVELIDTIRARSRDARIIVCTIHDEIWTLRKLISRDVNAIIYKSGTGEEILTAMAEILSGRRYFCDTVHKALHMANDRSAHPSSRELEVLDHIAEGKTTREIAADMFVSDNTVESHRKSLFAKLRASNVADLIVKAITLGYLRRPSQKR